MARPIAKGLQGQWFAIARNGERLPCVFREYWQVPTGEYHDPHCYDLTTKRGAEYIEGIKRGKVLMTRNIGSREAGWRRESYIGVFLVEDVEFSPTTGLTFKVMGRE